MSKTVSHNSVVIIFNNSLNNILLRAVCNLNQAAKGRVTIGDKEVHLLPIAPSHISEEVDQLELDRGTVYRGMRDGALRVFELFAPAMNLPPELSPAELVDLVFPLSLLNVSCITDATAVESTSFGIDISA